MNLDRLRSALLEALSADVEFGAAGSKFYCALPLEYPSGDAVVVYLDSRDDGVEVSDYGAGWEAALRAKLKVGRLTRAGERIAADMGVHLVGGSITASTDETKLADVIWRVGLASARVGDAATFQTTETMPAETDFVEKVDAALSSVHPVEREIELEGTSGHRYTATFFVPARHSVVEPVTPQSGWNRAAHVYAEFGDLGRVNGYVRLAVIDDRETEPNEQVVSLLTQVSDVVRWSRRDVWLGRLRGTL